ncbi:MAG: FecR domain-containing protein [Ignavibacteriaceae bacterium]
MSNQNDWPLLAKNLSGECSDEESAKVKNWLEIDMENQKLLNSMNRVWESPEMDYEPSDIKALWTEVAEKTGITGDSKEQIIYKMPGEKQDENIFSLFLHQLRTPLLRYAAVFLLVISITFLYYLFSVRGGDVDLVEWKTVTVDNSKQSSLTLKDGTKLFLDSGSRLQIPDNFGIGSREVKLEGEAYFEVAPDPEKPFSVYSANAVVSVLGTKFNVRAWEESGKTEVAVAEGKVSFGVDNEPKKQIILNKGFGGTLSQTGELSAPGQVDISKSLSWMRGEMSFDDVALFEILAQLERWYDIQFSLRDSTIINERLSVSINKSSLSQVLEVLSTLTDTEYKIDGKVVSLIPLDSKN